MPGKVPTAGLGRAKIRSAFVLGRLFRFVLAIVLSCFPENHPVSTSTA
jgi:hypothetical protein